MLSHRVTLPCHRAFLAAPGAERPCPSYPSRDAVIDLDPFHDDSSSPTRPWRFCTSSSPSWYRRLTLHSQVPGVALAAGAITVAVAAGTVYSASRRLLPREQRRVLDIGTGLVALAAAAYLLHT